MDRKERRQALERGKHSEAKQPYEKPACRSEKIFETTALACGKRPGQGGLCSGAPHSS